MRFQPGRRPVERTCTAHVSCLVTSESRIAFTMKCSNPTHSCLSCWGDFSPRQIAEQCLEDCSFCPHHFHRVLILVQVHPFPRWRQIHCAVCLVLASWTEAVERRYYSNARDLRLGIGHGRPRLQREWKTFEEEACSWCTGGGVRTERHSVLEAARPGQQQVKW